MERRLHLRRGGARHPARHDPGDGADRDAARRVRDGRDPLRAARPLGRAERRPLGLHLLADQVLPRAARLRAARPRRGDDDRAVHARLHRAAGQDLPPPRRARDGRHGRADPLAQGRGGQREGDRGRARGQGARGRGRLRRHLGRAPRPRADVAMEVFDKVLGDEPNQVDAPARRRRRHRRPSCSTCRPRRATITERGPAQRRQRRHPVHLVLAARQRRRGASTT